MQEHTLVPPLALSAQEFVDTLVQRTGRGSDQARALYREWMQRGSLTGDDPCFANCPTLRTELIAQMETALPEVASCLEDGDTCKAVLRLEDGLLVEMVLIAMRAGHTLCVSSQVGCQRGCAFCETGRMGLLRNLTTEEIVSQLWIARHQLSWRPRNLVFMGMGEPLDNLESLMQSLRVLMEPHGLGVGPGRITVSTVGHLPGLRRLLHETPPSLKLALSLHAPNDALRNQLMPVNRQWNLSELREVLCECTAAERCVLIEYILIAERTDTLELADQLAAYLQGLSVRVNCIPYNPQSRATFQPPSEERQRAFIGRLRSHGLPALLRHHRGRKAMAACGQLGNVVLAKELRQVQHSTP